MKINEDSMRHISIDLKRPISKAKSIADIRRKIAVMQRRIDYYDPWKDEKPKNELVAFMLGLKSALSILTSTQSII